VRFEQYHLINVRRTQLSTWSRNIPVPWITGCCYLVAWIRPEIAYVAHTHVEARSRMATELAHQ
jgi:hypothetical protein